jgi:CheY-specific phosphatase CheX
MDETLLVRALDRAMREALSEMLPKVPFEQREVAQAKHTIGDAAIVAMSGFLCGSLIVLTPRESTVLLARRLVGSLADEDDGQMAENGFLTQLEQDSIRELSNRVSCIFAEVVSAAGRNLQPTFPIFVCGQDIDVVADSDHRVGLGFVVDGGIRVDARAFLSTPKQSASREERIRELERMREELLADEKK